MDTGVVLNPYVTPWGCAGAACTNQPVVPCRACLARFGNSFTKLSSALALRHPTRCRFYATLRLSITSSIISG